MKNKLIINNKLSNNNKIKAPNLFEYKSVIKDIKIKINDIEYPDYFKISSTMNYLNNYSNFLSNIHNISFSLYPTSILPLGSINLKNINNFKIELKLDKMKISSSGKYIVKVYLINQLKIRF